jgi:general secretion pathway protein J
MSRQRDLSRRSPKGEGGFTLIELLVAMVIFSAITGAAWALLMSGRSISSRGTLEAQRHQTARRALRAIESDLRAAFTGETIYDTGFLGTSEGTQEEPLDTVAFVAFVNQPSATTTEPEMDLARVAWSIDEDDRTEQRGLVRERLKRITEVITVLEPGAHLEEIARDVVALGVRYYDGTNWQDTWDSMVSLTVPKAVEVTIRVRSEYRGKEEFETFSTRVWMPVAATAPGRQQ